MFTTAGPDCSTNSLKFGKLSAEIAAAYTDELINTVEDRIQKRLTAILDKILALDNSLGFSITNSGIKGYDAYQHFVKGDKKIEIFIHIKISIYVMI
jgi:hypothetical protein